MVIPRKNPHHPATLAKRVDCAPGIRAHGIAEPGRRDNHAVDGDEYRREMAWGIAKLGATRGTHPHEHRRPHDHAPSIDQPFDTAARHVSRQARITGRDPIERATE